MDSDPAKSKAETATTTPRATTPWLAQLDDAMAASPWHPRLVPFFLWILVMAVSVWLRPHAPLLWPALYAGKCAAVVWLLWRYRRLIPEVNWRFHWAAVPTAVGLLIAWIGLGWWMAGEFGQRFDALLAGQPIGLSVPGEATTTAAEASGTSDALSRAAAQPPDPGFFAGTLYNHWLPGLFLLGITLKLIGMALVVPMFEELFTRSALLRGLNKWQQTKTGMIQFACDLPVLGEWLIHTDTGRRATQQPPALTEQLQNTAVGVLGVTGVVASTLIFTASHLPRDWPGAVACGLVWCGLLWWTNRGDRKLGLGPVIWSHALTNALLWGYTLITWDWQFL